MTALAELARRQSGAGREAGRAVALQVLREVFAAPAARAALAVLAGGVHEDERIIELCSAVLDAGWEATSASRS